MKRKHYLLAMCLIFMGYFAQGQVNATWNVELPGNILWQQVTPLGNYLVGTSKALTSLDVDNGAVLWSLPKFGGLSLEQVQQAGNSPFISINKDNNISLVDPFSGQEVFNAANAGISEISSKNFLYNNNGILISGKSKSKEEEMLMADMGNGKIKWKIKEKFGRIVAVDALSSAEILVVTLFNNYRINTNTGDIIWKNTTSAEAEKVSKMGALGNLMQNVAEQASKDMVFKMKFFKHPSKDIFILGSEQEGTSTMSSSTSNVTFKNTYYAYNLNDGSRIWQKPLEMNGKLSELVFHQEGMIILPDNGANTKINFFDLKTMQGKWGKKGKGIKVKGGIYDYIVTSKGLLLISQKQDKNYLNFLDPNTGIVTFEKPVKINGRVTGTAVLEKGILYTTTKEVNILDVQSGTTLFPNAIPTTPELVSEKDGQLYLYDLAEKAVKSIDLSSGNIKNTSNAIAKFQGKETPKYIELREKGALVTSNQNLALVGYDGKVSNQKYFEAPREPGIVRALMYAQAIRAAYIGAVSGAASAQLKAAAPKVQEEDAVAGAMVEGFGEAYGQLANAASDVAQKSWKQANARFKATANGRDFMIILAKTDKGNGLLKVNKDTGEKTGEISLGKEKKPDYVVDDVTSQVYIKSGMNVVSSYKF